MSRALYCALILLASAVIAVWGDTRAAQQALTYATSGTCVNSPEGFNSKLEPVNPGTAWTTTFNAVDSADANGNVTEVGQSVDTASFGAGPRMHLPAAHAYKATFTSKTELNSDGSYSVVTGPLSGAFTDGPYSGKNLFGGSRPPAQAVAGPTRGFCPDNYGDASSSDVLTVQRDKVSADLYSDGRGNVFPSVGHWTPAKRLTSGSPEAAALLGAAPV
jgi:hypothetical protein